MNDDPRLGAELGYTRELFSQGDFSFGVEAALNYMNVSFNDGIGYSGSGRCGRGRAPSPSSMAVRGRRHRKLTSPRPGRNWRALIPSLPSLKPRRNPSAGIRCPVRPGHQASVNTSGDEDDGGRSANQQLIEKRIAPAAANQSRPDDLTDHDDQKTSDQ